MRDFVKKVYQNDQLVGLFVFALALIPRVVPSSGVYLNVDAAGHWITRTKTFLLGLTSGDVTLLAPSGHPGVPLMWLTSISEMFLQQVQAYEWFSDPIVGYLTILKLPVITMTAVLVFLVWWIGKNYLPRSWTFCVAVLFALGPLYLSFSRYLQLDALVTGFASVGIILWWATLERRDPRLAFWAGSFMALGMLTRLNGSVAFLFAVLTWALLTDRKGWDIWRNFCIGAGLTIFVLWPIVFVHPIETLQTFSWGVNLGFTTHEWIVSGLVPDWIRPLYYPIFLLTRISTLELGLFMLGLIVLIRQRKTPAARAIWFFLGWTVMVILSLAVARKHIDRYALPALFGIFGVISFAVTQALVPWLRGKRIWMVMAAFVVLWQIVAIMRLQPYFQTYRNILGELLVRTPITASSALWPDWGEGLREAMNELHRRTGRWPSTASWYPAVVCVYGRDFHPQGFPFSPRGSMKCESDRIFFSQQAREAEYILVSRDQLHQQYYPVNQIAALGWQPEFVIRLNGHPYVWVYQNKGNLPPMPK